MVEKRFALAYETNDQYSIWWAVRDGDITLWKEEVVDCLNSLHEENERLHDEIFRLRTELAYDRTVNEGKDWFKVEDEHLKWKSGEND